MTETEIREIASREVERHFSRVHFNILVSLVFALLMAVGYLWMESRTQYSWIVSLKAKVEVLEENNRFAEEVKGLKILVGELGESVTAIATKLGVQGDDSGEAEAE